MRVRPTRSPLLVAAVAMLALSACASQAQILDNMQPMAVQNAEARGRFELNCPDAAPTVLSREMVQPVMQGPFMNMALPRAEYTIGVSGCGARKTFIVICPQGGDGCFAAGPGRFLNE
jgi:hypothetical protein